MNKDIQEISYTEEKICLSTSTVNRQSLIKERAQKMVAILAAEQSTGVKINPRDAAEAILSSEKFKGH